MASSPLDAPEAVAESCGTLEDVEELGRLLESLMDGSGSPASDAALCQEAAAWLDVLRAQSTRGVWLQLESFLYLSAVEDFFECKGISASQRFAWLASAAGVCDTLEVDMVQEDVRVRLMANKLPRQTSAGRGRSAPRRSLHSFRAYELTSGYVLSSNAEEGRVLVDVGASIPCRIDGAQLLHSPEVYAPGVFLEDLILEEVLPGDKPVLRGSHLPPFPWRLPRPGQTMEGTVKKLQAGEALLDVGKTNQQAFIPRRFWRRPLEVGNKLTLRVLGVEGRNAILREVYAEEDAPVLCKDVVGLGHSWTIHSIDSAARAVGWPPWEAEAQRATPTPWYQVPLALEFSTGDAVVHAEVAEKGASVQVIDVAAFDQELRAVAGVPAPKALTKRMFPGAVLVGRIMSSTATDVIVDLAEDCDCRVPKLPTYTRGQALPVRILSVGTSQTSSSKRPLVLARPMCPAELSQEAQEILAKAPANAGDADLLQLPRVGTYVLGRVELGDPPRLTLATSAGASALLPLSGGPRPPVGAWVRGVVCGVDLSSDGRAVPLISPPASVAEALQVSFDSSLQIVPERPQTLSLMKIAYGKRGNGIVNGYAQAWTMPDGSTSDGLLISVDGETAPVFAKTDSPPTAARKESPVGMQAQRLQVDDIFEREGQMYALVSGRISQDLTVGSFRTGMMQKPTGGTRWRVQLADSTRCGTLSQWSLKKEMLVEGKEVVVRVLNTGSRSRLPRLRILDAEESWLTEDQRQRKAPPLPCEGSSACGRVLGAAATLQDDSGEAWATDEPALQDLYRRSDLLLVAQQVGAEDVVVAIDAVPCLGVIPASFSGSRRAGDILTNLVVVDIRGSGSGTYAVLEAPRVDVRQLEGKVVEGILRKREGRRDGLRFFIDVGAQFHNQPVYGLWKPAGFEGLRFSEQLEGGAGQRVSNVTVLAAKVRGGKAYLLLSPVAGDYLALKANQTLEGIVGKVFEYGVFFEVGCKQRVLCPSSNLLHPPDQYKYGQRVRRLVVHWPNGADRPQLSEGGPPIGSQAVGPPDTEEAQRQAFGVATGDELDGHIIEQLPYGVVLELEEGLRDGFCAKDDLLAPLEDFAMGDLVKVKAAAI